MNKKEKIVMDYIFDKASGKESVLISVEELAGFYENQTNTNVEQSDLDDILQNLSLDGYVNVITSDRKGKPIYCISLEKKGESYKRDKENHKRTTMMLVVRTVLLAVLSFVVGLVLKAIFT